VSRRLLLIACALGSGVAFLDQTVVNVALPALRADLGTGLAAQQWVVEAYLLTLSALLLLGGSLGDVLGRRKVFEAGLLGFGLTSLLCALAPSAGWLIAGRALQGVAGALLVPASLALITVAFPPEERGLAIGRWIAWTGVAFVAGPLAGGLLVDLLSWRWVFYLNVPLVAATLVLLRRAMPEPDRGAGGSVDVLGAALCALGLCGLVFALTEEPARGWGDPVVTGPLVGGALLLAAFVHHEARTSSPMLPLDLFRTRNFAVGNAATLSIFGGLGATTFFVTIYLQQVAGYGAVQAGLALVPVTVVMWLLAARFGGLADRLGPRLFMGVGPLIGGAGLLWLGRLDAELSYARDVLPPVVVFGIGLAVTVAPLTNAVLGAVSPAHAGVASGTNNAVARVGSLVAIAVVGAVVSASYAAALGDGAPAALRERPLSGGAGTAASVAAYGDGMLVAAVLVMAGGVISLAGIVNARRAAPVSEARHAA
jgi:EmrB/QacA subfamily drug resistance transporter